MQYQKELLNREMVDSLCELHKTMVESQKDVPKAKAEPVLKDVRTLMEAINSLEAMCKHPNAAAFFEKVCNPSRDAGARELCKRYQEGEFAKRAMLRYLFKGTEMASSEKELEEMMDAPDPMAEKPWDPKEVEWYWTTAIFALVLALLAAAAYKLLT